MLSYSPNIFADDEYEDSGSSSGNNYDGVDFTIKITTSLKYKSVCFWPLSGIHMITTDGEADITINYGDGECDDLAIQTVNGERTEIVLGQL